MTWLRNLPIARKFTFAFGVVCSLCILLGGYSFMTFRAISKSSADVTNNAIPSILALKDVRGAANNVRREDLDLLLCQTPACLTEHGARRRKSIDDYDVAVKLYEPMISYPGEREIYRKYTAAFAEYMSISDRGAALLAA
jgi:methyl-accepting chemotaxis protein